MPDTDHLCKHCGSGGFWSALGRGFRSLLRPSRREDRLSYIPVDEIHDNPQQPREYVVEGPHASLKASIEKYGVIVPVIVNRDHGRYVLIAGQRRLMAARELGMKMIPAIVRTLSPREMMQVATLENLHRESLNPIDLVLMLDRLRLRCPGVTETDLAHTMGLKPEEVARGRALLKLPVPVQEALRAGMVTEAQAEIVADIEDPNVQLEVVEMAYNAGPEMADEDLRGVVDRINRKEPSFITTDGSPHFHATHCPYAVMIPDDRRLKFYTKREAGRRGKVACMQCL
ncbi:MAG TPA: ParB/RepB/Spo0J family partition protein [Planctomycetota bacterium]|nr:ParB/RepB/Spo0J family partition protein [Planctomycetota bacterium]